MLGSEKIATCWKNKMKNHIALILSFVLGFAVALLIVDSPSPTDIKRAAQFSAIGRNAKPVPKEQQLPKENCSEYCLNFYDNLDYGTTEGEEE